jgi:hypothetical protein
VQETEDIAKLRRLLEKNPTHDISSLANEFANNGVYNNERDDACEIAVIFKMASQTIRLMQARDLGAHDPKSYNKSNRAKRQLKKSGKAY